MTARRLGRRAAAVAFAAATVALPALDAYGQPAAAETVVDIRVHGNHTTPDDDVVAVAGVAVGEPRVDVDLFYVGDLHEDCPVGVVFRRECVGAGERRLTIEIRPERVKLRPALAAPRAAPAAGHAAPWPNG